MGVAATTVPTTTSQKLAQARPDVLIVVAGDHLNQWFMDNMPAFVVGKAPIARGPFPHELRAHNCRNSIAGQAISDVGSAAGPSTSVRHDGHCKGACERAGA